MVEIRRLAAISPTDPAEPLGRTGSVSASSARVTKVARDAGSIARGVQSRFEVAHVRSRSASAVTRSPSLVTLRRNDDAATIVVRAIPPFEPSSGYLPVGEHEATWVKIVERFGWTPWCSRLLDGLAESLDLLAEAGCHRVWLNGSFVTAKEEPGDFDAVWDPEHVDDDALDPIFGPLGLLDGRRLQKEGLAVSGSRT